MTHLDTRWIAVVLAIASVAVLGAASEGAETDWEITLGGVHIERGYCAHELVDGGYIVLGQTLSKGAGDFDLWLLRLDHEGRAPWERTFGGPRDDWAVQIRETADGGFILLGSTFSTGAGLSDLWLIKADSQGRPLWERVFGGQGMDLGCGIQQSADGGYVLVGYTESKGSGGGDAWVIKTDPSGRQEWEWTYGGSKSDIAHAVLEDRGGGFVFVGSTKSNRGGQANAWLVRLDKGGRQLWEKTYGGTEDDGAYSLQQTEDGGFVFLGYTKSKGAGGADVWLVRVGPAGGVRWEKTFGGAKDDWGRCLQIDPDGGYVLFGSTASTGTTGFYDLWLSKTDSSGERQWERTYGERYWDRGRWVEATRDGGYLLVGFKFVADGPGNYDLWLIKTGQIRGAR